MLHGEEDPDLTEIRSSTKDKVDFHDPRAVRQLTASLLRRDFDLTVDLPPDRLCPPTSRYLYVRWIQDLVESINPSYFDDFDITADSLPPNPHKDRQANGFSARCHVMKTKRDGPLIPLAALELDQLDFTICNPPFFSSVAEWKASISGEGKTKGPNSVCTGSEVEMVTEGGDLGFVLRMVEESRVLGQKVAWYTSMLGKLSSTIKLVEKLRELGCRNWAEIARRDMNIKHILPLPTDYKLPISDIPMERFAKAIDETMHNLALQWKWNEELRLGYGRATKNVWSRSARRKRKREEGGKQATLEKDVELKDESDNEIALGFEISVQTDELLIRWVQGQDQVLFESFCGMMKQTLQPMLAKPQKEKNVKEEQ
ncbi:S-adenosyl-L-methionine dependent methyltransferase predicted [Lasiodiplodia theobromae]|uniref:S-adenosyl-L-methionine dependent methyltransferase predicted n=1 Tax=Lasiodiplodia theobromae TaxID=45133 RepID=UPI0015C3A763|nr:S-adenosyl-L-methionine dependent methyltransferase predicted [Lasiodiplodia theobromae]KAF4533866.1 S-adenosyl-L-methionine dependent methyltransferase predicted [Lasiodiplodia theobromae]